VKKETDGKHTGTMSTNFQDKLTTQKGNIGEACVDDYLRSKNIIPYIPVFEGAHPFDRLCAKNDGSSLYIVEVKTKARRTYYPDTGINISSYEKYISISLKYGIKVFLCFVDEAEKRCYGNWIHILSETTEVDHNEKLLKYPLKDNGIIYFPLCAMKDIFFINNNTINELLEKSSRNYKYHCE